MGKSKTAKSNGTSGLATDAKILKKQKHEATVKAGKIQPKKLASSDMSSESEDVSDKSSASSASSASDSEDSDVSEAVGAKKPKAVNGVKTNGVAKGKAGKGGNSSESSDSSDSEGDSESSGSESDDEDEAAGPIAKAKTDSARKPNADSESEDDSDDDSEDDSESDSSDDGGKKALKGAKPNVNGKHAGKEVSSDDDSDSAGSSDSDSSSGSDSDSESDKEVPPPKKRKAENEDVPAVKKQKTQVDGNADKRNLFVGHLSWNVDEEWLTRIFEPHGKLSRVEVMTDRESGRSRGFGYVEFENGDDAVKAQAALNGQDLDGRDINVDFSKPRTQGGPREDRSKQHGDRVLSPPSATIFVANIAFAATSDTIGDEFKKHGDVLAVRLPTDRDTGDPKGYGYVEFSSVDEAKKAFSAMNGQPIMGRVPRLDYSTPRPNGDAGGFGRGGNRGGFDRGGRGRGGFDRGGRGGGRGDGRGGGRGGNFNRGGFGDFKGKKMTLS